jgi:hypothetical protein
VRRYLSDYEDPKKATPRFLLNDVVRYWYTIAVDYQAKRWEGSSTGWGLRYLKLLNSRKIGYAGTLVSLLRADEQRPATEQYFVEEFSKTPLSRLAQLALDEQFDQEDALKAVLRCAERFAAFLGNSQDREAVESIASPQEARHNHVFTQMRECADELARALVQVFFQSHLGDRARKYLVF